MKIRIYLILGIFFPITIFSQVHVNIKNNKGDIVKKKVVIKNYNYTKKGEVITDSLKVQKYIDINKDIMLVFGGMGASVSKTQLIAGWNYNSVMKDSGDYNILNLLLMGNKLRIDCDVYGFDKKYIAKIVNNKLISPRSYMRYISDSSVEILDDYFIPVLQIYLIKKTNSILVNGVFFLPYGYTVLGYGTTISEFYGDREFINNKDSFLNVYIKIANKHLRPVDR